MFARAARIAGLLTAATVFAIAPAFSVPGKKQYDGPKMDFSQVRDTFRMGFLGDEAAQDVLTRTECLKDYIQQAYGVPVKTFTFKDYAGTMEAMLGGNLDYTWLGASAYAGIYLRKPDAVEPLVTRRHPNGETGYYSVMVARQDSGIKSLSDTKGKRIGYSDPNSTSGYLIPSITLTQPPHNLDIKTHFASAKFMGGHENAILGLLNGDVDVAVTWASGVGEWDEGYTSGNLRKMVDKGVLNMDDIVQVWSSKLIPNGPVVMAKSLPRHAKDVMIGLKDWLLKNDLECAEGLANGLIKEWVRVDHSFYETVVKARKAKIDARKNKR